MKIEIELLDEPNSFDIQMSAINKYIKDNTISSEDIEFFGLNIATKVQIKTTAKNTGVKIEQENTWRKFHVSCSRTKGGLYKFKVWNA